MISIFVLFPSDDDLMPLTHSELDWRKDMIQEIQFQGMTHDAI